MFSQRIALSFVSLILLSLLLVHCTPQTAQPEPTKEAPTPIFTEKSDEYATYLADHDSGYFILEIAGQANADALAEEGIVLLDPYETAGLFYGQIEARALPFIEGAVADGTITSIQMVNPETKIQKELLEALAANEGASQPITLVFFESLTAQQESEIAVLAADPIFSYGPINIAESSAATSDQIESLSMLNFVKRVELLPEFSSSG